MLRPSFIHKSAMAATALALAVFSTTSVATAAANTSSRTTNNFERIWGSQFRDLRADIVIFNKLKSHSEVIKNSSNPAQLQRYFNEYAFALKQSQAIIRQSDSSSTSTVKVNNRVEKSLTAEQELAMYLHMIRGLQEKIAGA